MRRFCMVLLFAPPFFECCGTKVRGLHDIVRRFRHVWI